VLFYLDTGQEAVAVQISDRGHGNARRGHRTRQTATEADPGQDVLGIRVYLAKRLRQPALGGDAVRLRRVHDVHRPEVRAVGVLVADPLDYGHVPVVKHLFERSGARVERKFVVDRQNAILAHTHHGSNVVVKPAGVRDERVHEVISAGQLDYYQYRRFAVRDRNHLGAPPGDRRSRYVLATLPQVNRS